MAMYSKRLLRWLELAEVALRPKAPCGAINGQPFGDRSFREDLVEHTVSEGEKIAQDEAESARKGVKSGP